MADILPYLGIQQTFTEEDASGRLIVLDDLTGLTLKEAEKLLKEQPLTIRVVGSGDTITGQIPAAGETIAGNSQVLVYLGEKPPHETVTVPDFVGMNRQQASDTALNLGLNILISGNTTVSPTVTVYQQSMPAGDTILIGTTIRLEFSDTKVAD
jgi:stage V sporulation protein D (sporulation-specific penicillin-binding protein)